MKDEDSSLPEINPRQQRFVEEFVIDGNATQAAIRSGYSTKGARQQGSLMLTNTDICEHIDALKKKLAADSAITHKLVLSTILETVNRCMQSVPVVDAAGEQLFVETKHGKVAAAYRFQPQHVLKGSELLGRHLGMFTDNITMKDEAPMSEYTTEELIERLQKIKDERGNIH